MHSLFISLIFLFRMPESWPFLESLEEWFCCEVLDVSQPPEGAELLTVPAAK